MPVIPDGAEVSIYGSWKSKEKAYKADGLCVSHQPSAAVSGIAAIDAAVPANGGTLITADGRFLFLPSASTSGKALLACACTPQPGQWLNYSAVRQPDSTWRLTAAQLAKAPKPAAGKDIWKPFDYRPPTPIVHWIVPAGETQLLLEGSLQAG